MNLSILQVMANLKDLLDGFFAARPFVYKGNADAEMFKPAIPKVYVYTVPPEDRTESGYPVHAPAICLCLDGVEAKDDAMHARISVHIAVIEPSTSDAETVVYNKKTGKWTFSDGTDFDQSRTFQDLYEQAVLLENEVMYALMRAAYTDMRISSITMTPPPVALPDFPHAECVVNFQVLYGGAYGGSYEAVPDDYTKYL